jgi:hypothetical protein
VAKRVMVLMCLLAMTGVSVLAAQSNEVLDTVLGQASLSYANAAYLVGTASGHFADTVTPEEAVPQLEQAGLGLPGRKADDPVTLGDFSYMLTRAFGIHGGIMYTILPGPRYATRELAYLDIISGPAKPGMALSGERALRILEQIIHGREAAR